MIGCILASPLGRGVTAGDGEGEPAGKTSQSPPATALLQRGGKKTDACP